MIPKYRLINHLLLLKSNYFFKREIKKQLGHLPAKAYRSSYNLVFNCNKNLMFIKIISVYLEFNKISYKKHLSLVASFILTISALMPILKRQEKLISNFQITKATLLMISNKEPIQQWLNNCWLTSLLPDFLINSLKISKTQLLVLQQLVHVSGKTFESLNETKLCQKENYEFGSLLMLFYILDLETRSTLMTKDVTNLNLKSFFSYELLFTNKLIILDKLINSAMLLEINNFNLYIRVMNYALLGSYE